MKMPNNFHLTAYFSSASVLTRFRHSDGVWFCSCGSSVAAITSCLTLGRMANSTAEGFGLATCASIASFSSRHSFAGAFDSASREIASSPVFPSSDNSRASGSVSRNLAEFLIIASIAGCASRQRLSICCSFSRLVSKRGASESKPLTNVANSRAASLSGRATSTKLVNGLSIVVGCCLPRLYCLTGSTTETSVSSGAISLLPAIRRSNTR